MNTDGTGLPDAKSTTNPTPPSGDVRAIRTKDSVLSLSVRIGVHPWFSNASLRLSSSLAVPFLLAELGCMPLDQRAVGRLWPGHRCARPLFRLRVPRRGRQPHRPAEQNAATTPIPR